MSNVIAQNPAPANGAAPEAGRTPTRTPAFEARLKKRYAAERRFKAAGLAAILFSLAMLAFLLVSMTLNGIGGFQRAELAVPLNLAEAGVSVDPSLPREQAVQSMEMQGLPQFVAFQVETALGSGAAAELNDQAWREVAGAIADDPALTRQQQTYWLPASAKLAAGLNGDGSPEMRALAAQLKDRGVLAKRFDPGFLVRADATDPQNVGIWGALKGSILTMAVTLLLAFPVGVLAALYLEEFAPRNRWTDVIEVSINNLAAVPSIIFGLLGLAVFLWLFPNYRSAPLIGGMTLALPGILTGTIIGMARALGETAPLLMIGMRAFVAAPPDGLTSPATVLPVQIFLWSDEISRGFVERTSAAIIVLLLFLLLMNGLAIYLRNRFEKSW